MSSPNDPHSRTNARHQEDRTGRGGRGAMWFIVGGLLFAALLTAVWFLLFQDPDANVAGDTPGAAVEEPSGPGAETTAPTTAEEGPSEELRTDNEPATGEPAPAEEPQPAEQPGTAEPAPAETPAEPPTAQPEIEPDIAPPEED